MAVSFDNKDAGNYLIARGKDTDMDDIMACFSAKSNDQDRRQTFLSYATLTQKNEFYVATEKRKLIVMRRDTERYFSLQSVNRSHCVMFLSEFMLICARSL